MSKVNATVLLGLILVVTTLLVGSVIAADKGKYDKKQVMPVKAECTPSFRILPRELSKSLKISRIPTREPVALIIGSSWSCVENDQGLEICDIIWVVCNDDQSLCTQIP